MRGPCRCANKCVAILPVPMVGVRKVINLGSPTIKSRQSRAAGVNPERGEEGERERRETDRYGATEPT
jgi:hypothetical protein